PDLDPAGAVGRLRGRDAVIDIGAQRVQRHAAFAVPFHAGDFGAAETAGAVDADALCAQTHRRLHGALHGPAKGHAALELLSDVVGDKLRVDLGLPDFHDVQVDLGVSVARQVGLQLLDVGALLADHDTRARRMDRDPAFLVRALD